MARRVVLLLALGLPAVAAAQEPGASGADPRADYDALYYRVDLRVFPAEKRIEGIGVLRARAARDGLRTVVLDLHEKLDVRGVHAVRPDVDDAPAIPLGTALAWERGKDRVEATLPEAVKAGDVFAVAVRYGGAPLVKDGFTGFHFRKTRGGEPWINTSCQGIGAHTWWPCKASFFHPEDKPDRVDLNVSVPGRLVAACNGALRGAAAEERPDGPGTLWRWRHDYPCPTYSIALNVAPYVELKGECRLPGIPDPVALRYYVLPEDVEKAKKEFAVVPALLEFYGEKFGPYPFPKAKFGLVQTSMWGMEHSSIVAYGNSWPSSIPKAADRYAARNKYFDYILIHESAHEWWGNAVTATDWGHFWVHEGFATYAEVLWVEKVHGAETMHEFAAGLARQVDDTDSIYRPRHGTGDEAYNHNIYVKGACVLHMLRYVMGDEKFFRALKAFNTDARFRYKNASTEDFQALCEKEHGEPLGWFFQSWLYGVGRPSIEYEERDSGSDVEVVLRSSAAGGTAYRMPVDVAVARNGRSGVVRLLAEPGESRHMVRDAEPADVEPVGLRWIVLRKGAEGPARRR